MDFDEPDEVGGTRLNPKEIVGHLLLVWAVDYIAHSPTQYSRPDRPSDVIVVDVVDLDLVNEFGQPGLCARRSWWRQAQLIQSLKARLGNKSPVLAVMGKGTASSGRAAPFQLTSMKADPNSVNRANAWAALNPGFEPSLPRAQVEVPQDPWNQQIPADRGMQQSNLPPPAPRQVTPAELTVLERMARQAQYPMQHQNQGEIPF